MFRFAREAQLQEEMPGKHCGRHKGFRLRRAEHGQLFRCVMRRANSPRSRAYIPRLGPATPSVHVRAQLPVMGRTVRRPNRHQ
jgi:hypothetical protein